MDETVVGEDGTAPRGPQAGGVGARLRAGRESAGLSLADVAQRTRVPLRHLEAIEADDYESLPSPTYAVGFARAYARAVGLDEIAVAADVRARLAQVPRAREYEPYEIPDPARVPSRGLAIVAAGAALAVLILAALWFGTDLLRGRIASEGAVPERAATATAVPAPVAATPAPAPTGGKVRLVATGRVWLRVYDAGGKTLFENTLNPGDGYDVPADATGPLLSVGRPDKLTVTLDGKPIPPLGDGSHAIKDVPVGGAAIAARLAGAPSGAATPAPAASASPTGEPTAHVRRDVPRPRPRAMLSETQRANLDAATQPAAGNAAP